MFKKIFYVALSIIFSFSILNAKTSENRPMTVKEKKERFISLVLPAVQKVYSELELEYEYIENAIIENLDNQRLKELREIYKAENNQELLIKIKPHPISITLAQAAVESGWATSRFFNIANNLFGVWSFNKDEARVPASETRGKKTIWIKKYENIEDSIRDYYKVLAKGRAYKEFRKLKMKTNDPYKLVKKLDKYSERGAIYGKELRAMIKYNKFYRFD